MTTAAVQKLNDDTEAVMQAIDDAMIAVSIDAPVDLDGLRRRVEDLCENARVAAGDGDREAREAAARLLERVVAGMDGLEAALRDKASPA